ncbi:unnamed protein product [Rotaria sp. Silwood2]|nr:unnamed protein product [Rotaria sp. Silwood2]CAF3115925.1 unnamed protein product [Rotaria sp. Silwood2]CAF3401896.1 unnamed protein product [Rotaria sp. Silwood2]CAF4401986.1 unnamed protein product [Rotaria sp. Silwood2]CAF4424795.1 unnamed protein product [Rotaria sp. Silwood2]
MTSSQSSSPPLRSQIKIPRPTTLTTTTDPSINRQFVWNIDHLFGSPSPLDARPRIFRPGMLIRSSVYERILAEVDSCNSRSVQEQEEEENDVDDDCNSSDSIMVFNEQQQQHSSHPLMMTQSGVIADHHRAYAAYGHLDRATIAHECQFNLEQPSSSSSSTTTAQSHKRMRLNAKSFAITAWTDVSKDMVLDHIKNEFGIENIQYICISEELSELNHERHLHI